MPVQKALLHFRRDERMLQLICRDVVNVFTRSLDIYPEDVYLVSIP